jgi:hypothetical protein
MKEQENIEAIKRFNNGEITLRQLMDEYPETFDMMYKMLCEMEEGVIETLEDEFGV